MKISGDILYEIARDVVKQQRFGDRRFFEEMYPIHKELRKLNEQGVEIQNMVFEIKLEKFGKY